MEFYYEDLPTIEVEELDYEEVVFDERFIDSAEFKFEDMAG